MGNPARRARADFHEVPGLGRMERAHHFPGRPPRANMPSPARGDVAESAPIRLRFAGMTPEAWQTSPINLSWSPGRADSPTGFSLARIGHLAKIASAVWARSPAHMSAITTRTQTRAEILKAMAHPARLFMMEELARGERCVCELREMVGTDLSTVSKHLTILRNAGLVEVDRRGAQVFYSLTVPCILRFLDCIDAVTQARARKHLEMA